MENGRHKLFNFQMSNLDTKIINEKLEKVLNKLGSAVKISIVLVFVLRNVETGEYRYYYAHKNSTFFEKLHLLCTKLDLITILGKVEKFDIVEQCTQEHQNTKWRFKLITNVPVFAAILKTLKTCEKIREEMTGGSPIVFTRKAVVVKTIIKDSSSICKSIVGIDAGQLYPYSICQDMPKRLYTRDGSLIPICKNSRLDISDLAILRTW